MHSKTIFACLMSLGMMTSLSGCVGGGGAALAGSALAGSVATGAITSGTNRARFKGQTCDQLAAEISSAQRSMINPLTIPSTQAYIKDARAVAAEKGCPAT
jgi:hypothetical protein